MNDFLFKTRIGGESIYFACTLSNSLPGLPSLYHITYAFLAHDDGFFWRFSVHTSHIHHCISLPKACNLALSLAILFIVHRSFIKGFRALPRRTGSCKTWYDMIIIIIITLLNTHRVLARLYDNTTLHCTLRFFGAKSNSIFFSILWKMQMKHCLLVVVVVVCAECTK